MPKIKVYKNNQIVIPVETSIISTGFQCPFTKKIFTTKNKYLAHLKKYRELNIYPTIHRKKHNKLIEELINLPTFPQIIRWIEDHPDFFFDNIFPNGKNRYGEKTNISKKDFTFKITYMDINWNSMVSNTHSSPRNGIINWYRSKDKPTGYPGWSGRIEFTRSGESGMDVFSGLGINTGTGGCSRETCGYDVKIFSSDWPGLEKEALKNILLDKTPESFRYGASKYFRR